MKISIFMSVLDVHVNRIPISGSIEGMHYRKGRFMAANLVQASEQNEQNWLWIRSDSGADIVITQVAGLIARRIVCWPEIGDRVVRGERFGMIRFGSRMDVYVPENSEILVSQGNACLCGRNRFMQIEPVKKRRSRRKRLRREGEAAPRDVYLAQSLYHGKPFQRVFRDRQFHQRRFRVGGHSRPCFLHFRHPGRQGCQADRRDEPFRGGIRFAGRPGGIRGGAWFIDVPDGPQTLWAARLAGCLRIHGVRRPAARALQCAGRNGQQEVFRGPADPGRGEHDSHNGPFYEPLEHCCPRFGS